MSYKDFTIRPQPGQIQYTAYRAISEGWDDEMVLKFIRHHHPHSRANAHHVRWYRSAWKNGDVKL
jgi:hypothetical protein